jgi:hypothetical protein
MCLGRLGRWALPSHRELVAQVIPALVLAADHAPTQDEKIILLTT